jgi:hypothetical protein
MTNKELIKYLVKNNDYKYNLLKTAEELQELSLVLTQMALKEEKVDTQEVIDEIGDVKIRLKVLGHLFSKKDVKKRIKYKTDKLKSYIAKNKYIGKL